MVDYLPRDAWTNTNRGGDTMTGSQLVGVSVHHPGSSGNLNGLSRSQVASRLRGWRDYHVNDRGWSDIGYGVAVDGAGRVWDLRGIRRVPAASASDANPDANREWGACLFVLGNHETPTDAAVEAFQHWRHTRWLDLWRDATRIAGHRQVPGAETACPGDRLIRLINDGTLAQHPQGDDDMGYLDWPKKDRDALADDVARRVWNHAIAHWSPGDTDERKDDKMPAGQALNQARGYSEGNWDRGSTR